MSNFEYQHLERPLPAFGVLALAVDGVEFSVIAKALDVPCSVVKGYVELALRDLCSRFGVPSPVAKRPSYTLSRYIVGTLSRDDVEWTAALSASEQLAVIEARAYFRAFENRLNALEY